MSRSLLFDAVAHHIWANERLFESCADLTPKQLTAPVPGTYGSIIDTLRHLVRTDGWYLTFFRDWTNAIDEDSEASIPELQAAFSGIGAAWLELIDGELDGDTDIAEQGEGWVFHSPLGFRYAQAIHHGTDHRSQVCTALTSLGIEPPKIDVWAYGEATGRTRAEYLTAP